MASLALQRNQGLHAFTFSNHRTYAYVQRSSVAPPLDRSSEFFILLSSRRTVGLKAISVYT